ncbi:MAG: 16S rRNA (cytidine(1402)-2'-O)-methyltransferase [Anaerolineae bacterium]|nr:16S rRNA (cytidine(1402)-2'-O)-methyltransferase [Anaerolineae bacterium]
MGTLYVVATPIGNLEDITLRALRTLKEVRLIAAEDTRTARKLLARYEIHTPTTSFFTHNQVLKTPYILEQLAAGDVALISEAGTPGVSDPGAELVRAAIGAGYPIVPIPGPSAVPAAMAVSGLPADRFVFLGFLPRRRRERLALLEQAAGLPWTLVFFEAPHRVLESLEDVQRVLGDRPAVAARELTKLHEEVQRGTLSQLRAQLEAGDTRGEFTFVVAGAPPAAKEAWPRTAVAEALRDRIRQGTPARQAARDVARASGWRTRDAYELYTEIKREVPG